MGNRIDERLGKIKGEEVSIGIDVHMVSWKVTVHVEGEVVLAVQCLPQYAASRGYAYVWKGTGSECRMKSVLGGA